MNAPVDLLLASTSPRRRELLTQIGVRFAVIGIDVPEVCTEGESPSAYVQRLAREKAQAGARVPAMANVPVLGADTLVVIDHQILEKPANRQQGLAMLNQLSGRSHEVLTAVAVHYQERTELSLVSSRVFFRTISPEEQEAYWLTGEPMGKAGGYAIQGLAAVFVERIEGSYSGVVGLPLAQTQQLLARFGVPVWTLGHE